MNIVLINDSEWKFGDVDRIYDKEHDVLLLRHTNASIQTVDDKELLPDEDVYNIFFPTKQPDFSLEEYAEKLTEIKDKNYTSEEVFGKVLDLKRNMDEILAKEKQALVNKRNAAKYELANKQLMSDNIKQLLTNLDNIM